MSPVALKQELIETDNRFRALYEEHQTFKQQLQAIREHSPIPTDEEEIEIKRIKFRKLELKDQMEAMLVEHRRSATATA